VIDWPSADWPTICPFCRQHHDAATHAYRQDYLPADGDVSLCFGCGEFCVFDDKAFGGMRKPTKKEQRTFARDKRLQELRDAWETVKRQRK
jgi:hypothetical protein